MPILLHAEIRNPKIREPLRKIVNTLGYIPGLNIAVALGRLFYVLGVKCERLLAVKTTRIALRNLAQHLAGSDLVLDEEKKKLFEEIRAHVLSIPVHGNRVGSISFFGYEAGRLFERTKGCELCGGDFKVVVRMKEAYQESNRIQMNLKEAAWEIVPFVKPIRDIIHIIQA